MSGATAAHASYNGSGTQGLAVTNKINDTGDIMSVFWTKDKTTKQLLHGCALIEIPSSGGTTDTPGSSMTFTMNSDMDVIGDLYVHVRLTFGAITNITKEYGLLHLFERIEFQCGTQIWQTLEFADILALNTTELSEGAYEKFILGTGGFFDSSGGVVAATSGIGGPTDTDFAAAANEVRNFSFRLPMLTRNLGPMLNNYSNISESGFLTAAAPNQTVKVKIFTNKTSVMSTNNMIDANNASDRMEVRLFGKHMIMCNEEREKIRSIPGGIAKRLKLTQYRDSILPPFTASPVTNIELDCDHFSLYASHLIIQVFDNTVYTNASSDSYKLDAAATTFNDECTTLLSADLKLNSTSFCGTLTGGAMAGPLPESMGLYVNNFFSRTDPHTRTIVYVFPLANKAFSGSGVPLNRFDNIRLSLKLHSPETASTVRAIVRKVSVTCVGETTALYKQGAASISMY